MKTFVLILLIAFVLLLVGCSASREVKITHSEENECSVESQAAPSRGAVFVYGATKNLSNTLILQIGGEPVLLSSGYLRLAGVAGEAACIELGGRGLALEKGEKIDDYRIVRIEGNYVVLEK